VDRTGREQVLPVQTANFDAFGLSPDGKRVATEVIKGTDDGGDIFLFGLKDSIPTRLTFRGLNRYPTWTPDGRRVAFSQFEGTERDIVWKPADGSGAEQALLKRPGEQFEVEFSRDGRWMIYREGNANTFSGGLGLHYQRIDGSGEDREFHSVPSRSVVTPALSPDGRWLAYASDESGQSQIYVRPFPRDESGAVWQVSTVGGIEPLWAPSGRELYYKEAGYLMAAETRSVPTFSIVARRRLFEINKYTSNQWHPRYAVLPGDRGFLMVRAAGSGAPPQMTVVVNWAGALPE
jgi:Tol biopolymer transport system component